MTDHSNHAHFDGRCLPRPVVTGSLMAPQVAQPRSCTCTYAPTRNAWARVRPDPDCPWHHTR